jgi:hypothetical protein
MCHRSERRYSHLSHLASYDGGPQYRWQWGDGVPMTPVREDPPGQRIEDILRWRRNWGKVVVTAEDCLWGRDNTGRCRDTCPPGARPEGNN